MKKSLFILLLAVLAFGATSCSSSIKSMKEPLSYIELNSHDYTLSDIKTGEATGVRVLGIDWERLFNVKAGFVTAPIIGIPVSNSQMYAVYDLLEKNPGYDFVMYPQVLDHTTGFPGIYTKTEIKVTARLGKLK